MILNKKLMLALSLNPSPPHSPHGRVWLRLLEPVIWISHHYFVMGCDLFEIIHEHPNHTWWAFELRWQKWDSCEEEPVVQVTVHSAISQDVTFEYMARVAINRSILEYSIFLSFPVWHLGNCCRHTSQQSYFIHSKTVWQQSVMQLQSKTAKQNIAYNNFFQQKYSVVAVTIWNVTLGTATLECKIMF